MMKNKIAIVTGSAGLIGSQACDFFSEKGYKIIPESVIHRMVKTYSELSKTYQHLATLTNPKDMVFFLNKKMK